MLRLSLRESQGVKETIEKRERAIDAQEWKRTCAASKNPEFGLLLLIRISFAQVIRFLLLRTFGNSTAFIRIFSAALPSQWLVAHLSTPNT